MRPMLTKSDGSPREFATRAVHPDDQWADALIKLFPTEVFTAYLAAVAVLTGIETSPKWYTAAWLLFGVGIVATVIYMIATWDPDPAIRRDELQFAWPQLVLAIAAFTVWAFSIGGAFTKFPWYEQWLGGLALIMGSLLLTGINKIIGTFAG